MFSSDKQGHAQNQIRPSNVEIHIVKQGINNSFNLSVFATFPLIFIEHPYHPDVSKKTQQYI